MESSVSVLGIGTATEAATSALVTGVPIGHSRQYDDTPWQAVTAFRTA